MLEDTLNITQGGDNVHTVVVELPQLAVVTLGRPTERVVLEELVPLPVRPYTPAAVVCECVTDLLEERVDARNTTVPAVLKILESQSTVLASFRFVEYSDHTRAESINSASTGTSWGRAGPPHVTYRRGIT